MSAVSAVSLPTAIFATLTGSFVAPWIGWRAAFVLSALPAMMVIFIRRQMPESDVWLADKAARAASRDRRRASAVVAEIVGPRLAKTTALAFTLTLLKMTAFWFKNIWLPMYFHQFR